MIRTALIVTVAILFLVSLGYAADPKYSPETIKKVDECKILKRDKKDMPESITGVKNIKAEELKAWLNRKNRKEKMVILDNRPADEFEKEHIPGSVRLNSDDLLEDSKKAEQAGLKKDDIIVNYCNGVKCWRSPATSVMLQSLGYKNIYWFRDGLPEWVKKGYPTAEGK